MGRVSTPGTLRIDVHGGTPNRLKADYDASGLELAEWFTDEDDLFALSLASAI